MSAGHNHSLLQKWKWKSIEDKPEKLNQEDRTHTHVKRTQDNRKASIPLLNIAWAGTFISYKNNKWCQRAAKNPI